MTLMTTYSKIVKIHNIPPCYKIVLRGGSEETRSLLGGKWRFPPMKVILYSEESQRALKGLQMLNNELFKIIMKKIAEIFGSFRNSLYLCNALGNALRVRAAARKIRITSIFTRLAPPLHRRRKSGSQLPGVAAGK